MNVTMLVKLRQFEQINITFNVNVTIPISREIFSSGKNNLMNKKKVLKAIENY